MRRLLLHLFFSLFHFIFLFVPLEWRPCFSRSNLRASLVSIFSIIFQVYPKFFVIPLRVCLKKRQIYVLEHLSKVHRKRINMLRRQKRSAKFANVVKLRYATLHRAFLRDRFHIVLLLPLFILSFVFFSYYFSLIYNNILRSKIITNLGALSSLYFHALSDIDHEINVIRHGAATEWNFTFTVGKKF